MKTQQIITSITILILTSIFASSCTKKYSTCGANIIRYKINGVERESKGGFSTWGSYGNSISFKYSKNLFFIHGTYSNNNSINITLNNANINSKEQFGSDSTNNFIVTINSMQNFNFTNQLKFKILENSSSVLAGTFSGKLYGTIMATNTIVDSIEVTDGFFDMPK